MIATSLHRVEFEDSRFDVYVTRPTQSIRRIVKLTDDGGAVVPVVLRASDTGFWDGHVWIPLRWVWRQVWREAAA